MSAMPIVRKMSPALGLLLALPVFAPVPFSAFAQSAGKAPAVVTVQVDKPLHSVSPTLYGLMTEEINFSYDGGLYPEMVKNRTMRDRDWNQQDWLIVQNAAGGAKFEKDMKEGPSAALTDSIKLTVTDASAAEPAGIRNMGYWGYPLRPDMTYAASVYAKADGGSVGPVHLDLVSNKTGKSVASAQIASVGSDWKEYKTTLKTGRIEASEAYHLELTLTKPGTMWFTLMSVIAADLIRIALTVTASI